MYFSYCCIWILNFTEVKWSLFPGIQLQYVITGSGNGLAPNRCQAITWTNDDPVHWCGLVGLIDFIFAGVDWEKVESEEMG